MAFVLIPTAALVLATGVLGGMFIARAESKWCPVCGVSLTCPLSGHHPRRQHGDSDTHSPSPAKSSFSRKASVPTNRREPTT
jgi:hypothetical protein